MTYKINQPTLEDQTKDQNGCGTLTPTGLSDAHIQLLALQLTHLELQYHGKLQLG